VHLNNLNSPVLNVLSVTLLLMYRISIQYCVPVTGVLYMLWANTECSFAKTILITMLLKIFL